MSDENELRLIQQPSSNKDDGSNNAIKKIEGIETSKKDLEEIALQPKEEIKIFKKDLKNTFESITLEKALEEQTNTEERDTAKIKVTPAEKRKNYTTLISGKLAQKLWWMLGGVVFIHLIAIVCLSFLSVEKPDENDTEHSERFEKAISNVNESSKTLYTFLTPLATAVTGYYFTTLTDNNSNNNSDND